MGHLGQESKWPGPGRPSPRGPSGAGLPVAPPVLWPGLPEATLLRRLPPGLPPGPRLLKAPAQGWSELRQIPLPLLPHIFSARPSPGSQHRQGQGLAPHSPALPLPAAPMVPRHPTSRTEPASFAPPTRPAPLPGGPHTSLSEAGGPRSSRTAATGSCLQTSTGPSLQWPHSGPSQPLLPAPRHYLGNLCAVFQRSVSCKYILKYLVVLP